MGNIEQMEKIIDRLMNMIEETKKTLEHDKMMPHVIGTFKDQVRFNKKLTEDLRK